MGTNDAPEAKRIFGEALETPAHQRGEYLDKVCRGDAKLRARVEALLAAHDQAGEFLSAPTGGAADVAGVCEGVPAGTESAREAAEPLEGPGTIIGRYKLLQAIGEGGFGTVYMAEQTEPVRRKVALKIIKLGMDTKRVIARFEAERQALAMMDHPNIAHVLDAGATDSGRPYFVMELVRGVSITKYCDTERLDTQQRLKLFQKICQAVQHAHQKGIIHRDIKPTNVMITMHDGVPVPKVIDFGIAKATAARLTEKTLFTEYGQFIGTPVYMSPEQAEMSGLDIDTRSDIYSLGVLLYELLTGTTPFDAAYLRRAAYEEIRRIIREEEPPKPSTRLSALQSEPRLLGVGQGDLDSPGSGFSSLVEIARHRRSDPAALRKLLHGDLDWIVMKCLEKDRQRRYDTANELAMEVERYLTHEPVLAGPPGRIYRFRKFAKRNRAFVGSVGAVFVALAIGVLGTSWQAIVASQQRRIAESERDRAVDAEQRAQRRFGEVRALANTFIFDVHDEIQHLPGATEARRLLATTALEYLDSLAAEAADDPSLQREVAGAYVRVGNVIGNPRSSNLGDTAGALSSYRKALAILEPLGEADPTDHGAGLELARTYVSLGEVHEATGATTEALSSYERAISLANGITVTDPANRAAQRALAAGYGRLGSLEVKMGRTARALGTLRQAVAIGEELVAAEPQDTAALRNLQGSYLALGKVQEVAEGQTGGALASYEASAKLAADLCEAEPHNAAFQYAHSASLNLLGDVLNTMGRTDEALERYQQALAVSRSLAQADPNDRRAQRNLGFAYERIGYWHQARGEHIESLDNFQRGLEVRAATVKVDANDLSALYNLVISHLEVGSAQVNLGDRTSAQTSYETAVDHAKTLVSRDPDDRDARRLLSVGFDRIGTLQKASGDLEGALETYRRMFEISRARAEADPTNTEAQRDVSVGYGHIGNTLRDLGKHDEALANLRKSLEVRLALVAADPVDTEAQLDLAHSYEWIGELLGSSMGRPADALDSYLKAVESREALARANPNSASRKSELAQTYMRIGTLQIEADQPDEARSSLRKSLQLRETLAEAAPNNAGAQRNLAIVLERLAVTETALASEANRPTPDRMKHLQAALTWYKRASDQLANMRERRFLDGADVDLPTEIAEKIAECEQSITALEAGATPTTSAPGDGKGGGSR